MTALDNNRVTRWANLLPRQFTKPVAADDIIFKGALVAPDASGHLLPGGVAGALDCIGVAMQQVDNAGGDAAAKECRLEAGVFAFPHAGGGDAIADADLPAIVYCADDQTVAKTSNGGTRRIAGIGVTLDDAGRVMVIVAPWVPLLATGVPSMQSVDATLVDGVATIDLGIVVSDETEVIPTLIGDIATTSNFGGLREDKASRVPGTSGVGTVVIEAVTNDADVVDADAAGDVRVVLLTPKWLAA